jgi:hypothetical protein
MPEFTKVQTAMAKTGKAGQKAWAQLTPGQQALGTSIKSFETAFHGVQQTLQPVIDGVGVLAVKFGKDLLPAIAPLAKAGGKIIGDFLTPLDKLVQTPFFANFVTQMSTLATQTGPLLGTTLVGVLKVFMQLFEQAGPAALKILQVLLPAIVQMATDLLPWITGLTKVAAWLFEVLGKAHLLIPALSGLGVAWIIGFGPVGWVIGGLAAVAVGLTEAWRHSQTFRDIVTTAFSDVGRLVLAQVQTVLDVLHGLVDGFFTVVKPIVDFAAMIPGPWQNAARSLAKSMGDAQIGADNFFNNAHAKIQGWGKDLANMPKEVKLKGDITDLQKKLEDAKRQLKDPNLTKDRQAKIKADISNLESQIRTAQAKLNGLNGKTVTTYVKTIMGTSVVSSATAQNIGSAAVNGMRATGGVVGAAASGGARGGLTMVGEHGRELVRLPGGSQVHSNPDTERMMGQGGGGGPTQLEVTGGQSMFEQFMAEFIRNFVRIKGGGDVQRAFGRA